MSEFKIAFDFMLPHEGGYSNNPHDHGGPTKFGISALSYPHINIHDLTLAEAEEIYRRDWWEKYGYGRLDEQAVANKVFDMAVNMGASRAHKILQEACNRCGKNIKVDGGLGPITVNAVNSVPEVNALLAWIRTFAKDFYMGLAEDKPQNEVFLKGWLKRADA
jgi:lysozyme family protein